MESHILAQMFRLIASDARENETDARRADSPEQRGISQA